MNIRTDLAMESVQSSGRLPKEISVENEIIKDISVSRVIISSEQAARKIGKPAGRYITVSLSDFRSPSSDFNSDIEVTAAEIKKLIPESGTILVAGLGNSDITPDAIGPAAASMILATRHLKDNTAFDNLSALRPVAAVTTGVLGKTGMETSEIVKCICDSIKPSAVIAIDALAAMSIKRLGRTIQISDSGVIPGSGVKNSRKALNKENLGVPVICIGIPTVADMSGILSELSEGAKCLIPKEAKGMMITPKEIDVIVGRAAKTAAFAVNKALFPEFSAEDFETLTA